MPDSVNNSLPLVPENTIDPAAGLNLPLANGIDALLQVLVQTVGANSPPGSPANGARYIVGTSPTGAWAGQANKLARYLDSAWQFFDARYALNAADGALYVRSASTWAVVSGGGGGGGEVNTASNLGAGSGLFAAKVGADLRFKSLVAGANVTLSSDGNTVTIAAGGGGAPLPAAVVTDSTTSRTVGTADSNTYLRFTSTSAVTVTIPPQSSVTWAADTEIHIRRAAAGNLTLTPGSGVTLNAPSGGTLVMTDAMSVTLKRVAENQWDVIGQTVPV